MSTAGDVTMSVGIVALCLVGWALNLIALPGNWIAVALLAAYACLGPSDGRAEIGFAVPAIAFGFAMLGEVLEFAASAVGAKKAGASRRSTLLAMAGSMVGAIAGAFIGIPVPIVGPVLAAILFGGLGATAGAIYGEWSDGRNWRESWSIGHAAFWGRTFGTLGKVSAGLAIVVVALVAVLF
ncbi:DUF456 domain-containing protein [Rubripirellula obstinata]|uniref:DUF456 domain-containing protein n=1 Tax=Rubripirellula obstinata TaxID=406547 RepID=UPI001F417596|nr:DUF456 domain-containing protein [Rubripirellula obstinata]